MLVWFFSHLGFWSGNLFLIAPFPDLCLLEPFSTLKEKPLSVTLEEEERLLASSPDVSIHAGEGFESASNPVSEVKDQASQLPESMDQSARPQKDIVA